jgi:hypothetical protein
MLIISFELTSAEPLVRWPGTELLWNINDGLLFFGTFGSSEVSIGGKPGTRIIFLEFRLVLLDYSYPLRSLM